METVAESLDAAAGLNASVSVHFAAAAKLVPQLFVSVKSAGAAPPRAIEIPVSDALPVFVSVTVFAALAVPVACLPKATLVALRVAIGAAEVPVPPNEIVCGEPLALSLIETVAVAAPVAVGLNSSVIVQLAFTAMLAAQLLVSTKSPGAAPPSEMETPVSAAVPLSVSVTDFAALVDPAGWLPKASLVALSVTADVAAAPGQLFTRL
jgi:hypothetical protein